MSELSGSHQWHGRFISAVSSKRPTKKVSKQDWPKMLAFLAIFEAADFRAGHWTPATTDRTSGVITMPWFQYDRQILAWIKAVYKTSFYIDPYPPGPDGEDGFEQATRFLEEIADTRKLSVATIDEIRQYMILCCRADRFCEGFINSQFESGNLVAALRRLADLAPK